MKASLRDISTSDYGTLAGATRRPVLHMREAKNGDDHIVSGPILRDSCTTRRHAVISNLACSEFIIMSVDMYENIFLRQLRGSRYLRMICERSSSDMMHSILSTSRPYHASWVVSRHSPPQKKTKCIGKSIETIRLSHIHLRFGASAILREWFWDR